MRKFFQKQREIITIIVYIGFIAMLIYFVVLPLLSRISGTKDQIQEETIKQEIKQQQISELPKMENQYAILQNNEKLVDVLLDKNDAVALIERLEKLAQDSGNEIVISIQEAIIQKNTPPAKAVQSKTNTDDELVRSLPSTDYLQMKITLTGNYNAIVKFVELLESFEYYCDIVAIQIKQKEENNKISDIGIKAPVSPFEPNTAKNTEETADSNNENKLEASLDAVFYTKK